MGRTNDASRKILYISCSNGRCYKVKNKFVQSFLFYVPYAVLAAMTFPAVIYSADGLVPGIAGTFTGLVFAYKRKSLLMVAVVSCIAVFIAEVVCNLV